MAPFDRSSPVLAIVPQAIHQVSFGRPFQRHASSAWIYQRMARGSLVAGRKRSRDEAAVNLDPPEKVIGLPAAEPEDEWIYGPGMIPVKKSTVYVADAGSQSGTWVKDKTAEEEAAKKEAALLTQQHMSQERPSLRSHKSQRLSIRRPSTSSSDKNSGRSSCPVAAAEAPPSPADSTSQPVVDDFTVHLGIGWRRLSADEHIQAAARGWARYIENHYPVNNVQIRVESRGLQSYLVEAAEGFFLFAESLRQGRLVSRTADRALQNLRASPPVFDGPETMQASSTPKLAPAILPSTVAPVSIIPSATTEMDMS